jgi:hypothetical protein
VVSHTPWHPTRHGIPHAVVSHTPWYPPRRGIPHGMVSPTPWYPTRHGTQCMQGIPKSHYAQRRVEAIPTRGHSPAYASLLRPSGAVPVDERVVLAEVEGVHGARVVRVHSLQVFRLPQQPPAMAVALRYDWLHAMPLTLAANGTARCSAVELGRWLLGATG